MGNSVRCFLACVLPCGVFDLVRVVHINGQVEEYSRQVSAGEVLRANPNHVLSKPCSHGGGVRRIVVVSPDSDLKRGGIYFLLPESSLPNKRTTKKRKSVKVSDKDDYASAAAASTSPMEVLPEKRPNHHRRRSKSNPQVGDWRPQLQSISEDV